ncbi:sarcosine oxidase subunit gamma [Frigidibacter sp. ROC022]|uniref:sarcosine oxidase subunit gamma n=1 Tax=Frigidibacter sp. ROC022 TaxID=2971796 RepID=UPI00215A3E66|nr:sarcosine oxidase subunit gamma family protein [Frigidibacter sp. ROC022]MCR8725680.1 sarcosine oxidase subunit gamma [Frigidibacter sp. ROC022]
MSETYAGYVAVSAARPGGMVTLRADPGNGKVKTALTKLAGALPEQRKLIGAEIAGQPVEIAWMAPDEWLIFCPRDTAADLVAALDKALDGLHHLALDVSDTRLRFDLHGAAVREVLAKLTPADMAALPLAEMRRTRLGQVAAGIWLSAEDRAHVIAFRSVGDYVFTALCHAARPGSEVG